MTSQRLLSLLSEEALYLEGGLHDVNLISNQQNGKRLFGPTNEFLVDCMKQYYFEFQAEIRAAPRLKSYLAQRMTINRLRSLVVRRDASIKQYDAPWKITGQTFIQGLPEM